MTSGRYTTTLLFLGDVAVFAASLWLTLLVRYQEIPQQDLLNDHAPFGLLFVLFLVVFYMAGLYGKRVVRSTTRLVGVILRTQLANIILAALVFFFVPGIGIAPKTNLVLYLAISLALILLWRVTLFPKISMPLARERVAVIADGPEVKELTDEVNGNGRYPIEVRFAVGSSELSSQYDTVVSRLKNERITLLVVDASSDALRPLFPKLYEVAVEGSRIPVADFHDVYEEIFDRVPLSLIRYDWFLQHAAGQGNSMFYAAGKRVIDVVGALCMGVLTLILTPLIALLMRLEGPGPVFIAQERLGRAGTTMRAYKFRSMRQNKSASGEWTVEERADNPVTKVGAFLRKTSLDEFPQFLNVLRGELSLIGPRNDILGLGKRLGEAIPYYHIRYLVTPGLTGWAQINQQYEQGNLSPQSVEETKMRLAYDFYYLKHRSLALDIVIALKTVKRMLFRVASA